MPTHVSWAVIQYVLCADKTIFTPFLLKHVQLWSNSLFELGHFAPSAVTVLATEIYLRWRGNLTNLAGNSGATLYFSGPLCAKKWHDSPCCGNKCYVDTDTWWIFLAALMQLSNRLGHHAPSALTVLAVQLHFTLTQTLDDSCLSGTTLHSSGLLCGHVECKSSL